MESNRVKGVFFIIMSAFGFALMSAFVKLAGDLPSLQKVFFRNLVASMVALYLIIKHHGRMLGKKENMPVLIMRSVFGTLGMILNFYAIDHLILADASMLNKISPFLVVIFSALFLKEKMNIKQIGMIVVAFIGALFIIKPSFSIEMVPYLAGLLGAVCAAAAYTCVRAIGDKEDYYTIVFFFSAFSMLSVLPFVLVNYQPMSSMQLLYLILAGVSASIGQFGVTLAYKYAPAREISIFDYTNIIFSAILGIFIFGNYPDGVSMIGYLIIFGSAAYMFMYNKKIYRDENKKAAEDAANEKITDKIDKNKEIPSV